MNIAIVLNYIKKLPSVCKISKEVRPSNLTLFCGLQGVLRGCFSLPYDHLPLGETAVFQRALSICRVGFWKIYRFLIEVGKEVAARARLTSTYIMYNMC